MVPVVRLGFLWEQLNVNVPLGMFTKKQDVFNNQTLVPVGQPMNVAKGIIVDLRVQRNIT